MIKAFLSGTIVAFRASRFLKNTLTKPIIERINVALSDAVRVFLSSGDPPKTLNNIPRLKESVHEVCNNYLFFSELTCILQILMREREREIEKERERQRKDTEI